MTPLVANLLWACLGIGVLVAIRFLGLKLSQRLAGDQKQESHQLTLEEIASARAAAQSLANRDRREEMSRRARHNEPQVVLRVPETIESNGLFFVGVEIYGGHKPMICHLYADKQFLIAQMVFKEGVHLIMRRTKLRTCGLRTIDLKLPDGRWISETVEVVP